MAKRIEAARLAQQYARRKMFVLYRLSGSVTIAADLKRPREPAVTEDVYTGEMIGKL